MSSENKGTLIQTQFYAECIKNIISNGGMLYTAVSKFSQTFEAMMFQTVFYGEVQILMSCDHGLKSILFSYFPRIVHFDTVGLYASVATVG